MAFNKEIIPHCSCEKPLAVSDKHPNSKDYPNKGKSIPGCRFGYTYGNHPPETDDQLARELSKTSSSRSILTQGKGRKVQFHVGGKTFYPNIETKWSSYYIACLADQLEWKKI